MNAATGPEESRELAQTLRAMALLKDGQRFTFERLSGGVSCDVYRVCVAERDPFVVKRALPKLRVSADWRAPPERATAEVAWIRLVAGIEPHWVPRILGEDRARHLFAMEYFPPERFSLWKARLAAGQIDHAFAASVGTALARIHGATAGRTDVGRAFAKQAQFFALRLEPYLLFTAERHRDLADRIRATVDAIAVARIALMQGDISPKNILCGPTGPVFLDAETACYGDPAFDLAFCLNHLLLKRVWHPEWTREYAQSFAALTRAYLAGVAWEAATTIERRTAQLLPMLFLARVDGKSPVEYLDADADKAFVREQARALLFQPAESLSDLSQRYFAVSR